MPIIIGDLPGKGKRNRPGGGWAAEQAERLRAALCILHDYSGMSWQMSASIGVALAPEHGAGASILYQNADAALYERKSLGKAG